MSPSLSEARIESATVSLARYSYSLAPGLFPFALSTHLGLTSLLSCAPARGLCCSREARLTLWRSNRLYFSSLPSHFSSAALFLSPGLYSRSIPLACIRSSLLILCPRFLYTSLSSLLFLLIHFISSSFFVIFILHSSFYLFFIFISPPLLLLLHQRLPVDLNFLRVRQVDNRIVATQVSFSLIVHVETQTLTPTPLPPAHTL